MLDSLNERASAVLIGMPWRKSNVPVSIGIVLDADDRMQSGFMYAAFTPFGTNVATSGIRILRVMGQSRVLRVR